jgi:hypothetical protein
MSRWIKYLVIGLIVTSTGVPETGYAQEGDLETNLKAAFLYNFTKYIDWQMGPDDSDFIIGVIGSSPVEPVLEEIARTGTVDGRRIKIRHVDRLEQVGGCQLLYISRKRHLGLPEVLSKVGRGEIAVAEESGAANSGAGFNFILSGDKLKFEANIRALSSSGLKISSQLLKLAIVVKE